MLIYCVTCKTTGFRYIGQTTQSLKIRWRGHCNDKSCRHLNNAIRKYGKENFEVKEIARATSLQELNELEESYIIMLGTMTPDGYNLKSGGQNMGSPCQETRDLIANTLKGHEVTKETRDKLSGSLKGKKAWNQGVPCKDETKQKLSIAKQGQIPTYKFPKGHKPWNKGKKTGPAWNKGIPLSEEHKENILETSFKKGHETWNKGVAPSEETRKKISDKNLGRKLSESTRKKMSESRKGAKRKPFTPEQLETHINAQKKRRERERLAKQNPIQLTLFNDE